MFPETLLSEEGAAGEGVALLILPVAAAPVLEGVAGWLAEFPDGLCDSWSNWPQDRRRTACAFSNKENGP